MGQEGVFLSRGTPGLHPFQLYDCRPICMAPSFGDTSWQTLQNVHSVASSVRDSSVHTIMLEYITQTTFSLDVSNMRNAVMKQDLSKSKFCVTPLLPIVY